MDVFLPLLLLLLGAALGLLLGVPLMRNVNAVAQEFHLHILQAREPDPPTPASEMPPLELAYLAGGSERVGEVALLDLLISGRARVRPKDGKITPVRFRGADLAEEAPIRREALSCLRNGEWVPARSVVAQVAMSDAIDGLRLSLAQRGFVLVSEETSRLVKKWNAARDRLSGALLLSWSVAIVCVGSLGVQGIENVGAFVGVSLGVVLGMFGLFGRGEAVKGLKSRLRTGGSFIAHTVAGTRMLTEALDEHQVTELRGGRMSHDVALRYCAIHGMKRMSRLRATSKDRAGSDDSGVLVDTNGGSAGAGSEGEGVVTWDEVCDLVGSCASDSGISGGDSDGGGDGGGGGGD